MGDRYFIVHGWMIKAGLKGLERDVYAVIYGYSREGIGEYFGSQKTLAETLGATDRQIRNVLSQLEADGFIKNTGTHSSGTKKYIALDPPGKKFLPPPEKSSYNKKDYNKNPLGENDPLKHPRTDKQDATLGPPLKTDLT